MARGRAESSQTQRRTVTKQSETREPRARPDRAARRRGRDPVGAPAARRPRRLAPDRARGARRPRARGLLVRRHGSGTFVSEPKIAQELTMTSFTEDMRRRGMVPGSRTLELRVDAGRRAPRPAAPRLALGARRDHRAAAARRPRDDGDRDAARARVARARPDGRRSRATVVLRAPPGALRDRRSSAALQTIEPTVTNEEESDALGVPLHSPAFLFERTTRSAAARSSSTSARSTAATATGS